MGSSRAEALDETRSTNGLGLGSTRRPIACSSSPRALPLATVAAHSRACCGRFGSERSRRMARTPSRLSGGLGATCCDTSETTGGATKTWKSRCSNITSPVRSSTSISFPSSSSAVMPNGVKVLGPIMPEQPRSAVLVGWLDTDTEFGWEADGTAFRPLLPLAQRTSCAQVPS